LRHLFASVGVAGNLGLPVIGRLLGHRKSETTAKYAHFADDPLRRAANAIASTIAASLGENREVGADIVSLRPKR
jgi:site-specific recombinase XerD